MAGNFGSTGWPKRPHLRRFQCFSASLLSPISRTLISNSRRIFSGRQINHQMAGENLSLIQKKQHANFRLISVSGLKTDLIEIRSPAPTLHVLFIPGNPGVISFYTDFLESLFGLLGGTASVTAIGHISHSEKVMQCSVEMGGCIMISAENYFNVNWESGRLFSLQEQIDHKISFIEQELHDVEVPIVLVGHSIGSYISLEIFKRVQEKVIYCIGLYPFLAVNTASSAQSYIRRIAVSPALCVSLSYMGALLGMLPAKISRFLVKKSIGKSWSSSAVEVLCTHLLQYHTIRNILFMTMTEFQKLPEKPDLDFIRGKKSQIAFLFGLDDHWGPLHFYEEIQIQVPGACLEVEREGHTHAFCCSEAGSKWVAQYVSSLIKKIA